MSGLPTNAAEFAQVIQGVVSPDGATRKQAESVFEAMQEQAPDEFAGLMLQCLCGAPEDATRTTAAVLFRKSLDGTLWGSLSDGAKAGVKSGLLQAVEQETSAYVRRNICDTVSELCMLVLSGGEWPELLQFVFTAIQHQNGDVRAGVLRIINEIIPMVEDVMAQHFDSLVAAFTHSVQDSSSLDIRSAAACAILTSITVFEQPAHRNVLCNLLNLVLATVSDALTQGKESVAQSVLEGFAEVAEEAPRQLRPVLDALVGAMVQIASHESLEDNTRNIALEIVVSLCESTPVMMKKAGNAVEQIIHVVFKLLLEIEDDDDWETNERDEDDVESPEFEVAEEALDRLSLSLGGKTLLPIAFTLIPKFVQNTQDWKQRVAGLTAIAQMSEGCAKLMKTQLEAIVQMVLQSMADPVARVRWTAINTLGQMCTDFGPHLQNTYHESILGALVRAMEDSCVRVSSHAAAAMINFSEECDAEVLAPYLDGIVSKLVSLLHTNKRLVQEQAITAIASVADCASSSFATYYDGIMTMLKQILTNANAEEDRLLRGKAVECASLVGLAVGRDRFRNDAKAVMELIVRAQHGEMSADDPQSPYFIQACGRICSCLQEEFVPFLPTVMPPLLAKARLEPDVSVTDALDGGAEDGDDEEDSGSQSIVIGGKRISIHTSVLEEKESAVSMLCTFVSQLGAAFFPYVEEMSRLTVDLLGFAFDDDVRSYAAKCIPPLIRASKGHFEASGEGIAPTQQLFLYLLEPLMNAVLNETSLETLAELLSALHESVVEMGPGCLSSQHVQALAQVIQTVIKDKRERTERGAQLGDEEDDDEETTFKREVARREEDAVDQVSDVCGALLRTVPDLFFAHFAEIVNSTLPFLEPTHKDIHDRKLALCILCDIFDYGGEPGHRWVPQGAQAMMYYATDALPEVRQAAVYGLGVLAAKTGRAFEQYAPAALEKIRASVSSESARADRNQESASDNAITAAGKICMMYGTAVDAPSTIAGWWLPYLPVKVDKAEAPIAHGQLCTFIEQDAATVLGSNNERLPHVLHVFASTYNTDLSSADVNARMKNILHGLVQRLGGDTLTQASASLPEASRQALASLMA